MTITVDSEGRQILMANYLYWLAEPLSVTACKVHLSFKGSRFLDTTCTFMAYTAGAGSTNPIPKWADGQDEPSLGSDEMHLIWSQLDVFKHWWEAGACLFSIIAPEPESKTRYAVNINVDEMEVDAAGRIVSVRQHTADPVTAGTFRFADDAINHALKLLEVKP